MRVPIGQFAGCALLFVSAAVAQGKVDTKRHCPNVSAHHELQVGDVAGHSYAILQGTCSAVSGDGSIGEENVSYTEFVESWKESNKFVGRWNVVTENGDKVFYAYEGAETSERKQPTVDKWKILNGTGKYKGIRGSGTCTGSVHDDGSSDWECVGEYSLSK
jgi:hypothetical protein